MRRAAKALAVIAAGSVMALTVSGTAVAAQWNNISGTAGNTMYYSTTPRHITTSNDTMKVQLSSFEQWGVIWKVVNTSYHNLCSAEGSGVLINTTSAVTICTGVAPQTFYNGFESENINGPFSGKEWY